MDNEAGNITSDVILDVVDRRRRGERRTLPTESVLPTLAINAGMLVIGIVIGIVFL